MAAKPHCLPEPSANDHQIARSRAGPAMARRPLALAPCRGFLHRTISLCVSAGGDALD